MFLTCVLKFCYIGDELYVRMTQGDFSTSRIYTVTDLVGKNILLYFSAHWCPPCRAFLPKLVDAYHKIKAKDDAFEVIFISSDRDQASFDEFFSGMPWLALPFGDPRKASLSRTHGCQDPDLDPTILRFYDLTYPKRSKSFKDLCGRSGSVGLYDSDDPKQYWFLVIFFNLIKGSVGPK